jgi:hypothetical protein
MPGECSAIAHRSESTEAYDGVELGFARLSADEAGVVRILSLQLGNRRKGGSR